MSKPLVNIADLPLESWSRGELYASADTRIGPMIGVRNLGISYSEVPPGKSSCPFHNHHVEDEMFIVLSGTGTYRFGTESYPIKAGDVLGAPAGGQETAHQIINTGSEPLRYLALSNNTNAEVIEYPDSGRVRVDVGATGFHRFDGTFKDGGKLTPMSYWEGEDIGEKDP